jgi:hypothetical protein
MKQVVALTNASLEVIREASLRESLETQARHFVEAEHDWKPLLQKIVELVDTVGAREHVPEDRTLARLPVDDFESGDRNETRYLDNRSYCHFGVQYFDRRV